ncbi:MAG: phosphatase PAP2 family protein [Cyclobacteriaceae bacterium]
MLQTLHELDEQLFLFLNNLNTDWLDTLMYWVTYKYTWFPFYFILILLVSWKFGWKGLVIMATVAISVGLADQVTSAFMKPYFGRPRPCHDPALEGLVHTVTGCGGRYGFASAHASTTFALASSLWVLLRAWSRWFMIAFLWSSLVAYSRVYVGVHYPGDILVGAMVGFSLGVICAFLHTWISARFYGYPITAKHLLAKKSS